MSVVSEARSYADSALESGKTTLSTVVEKLQSLPVDAKERVSTVADESKELATSAYNLVLRNAHAWIGATDALVANWSKRADDAQEESKKNASKLVGDTKSRLSDAGELVESVSAKSQELAEKAQERLSAVAEDVKEFGTKAYSTARQTDFDDVKSSTKEAIDDRFNALTESFNSYADRGEKVVADLRKKSATTVAPEDEIVVSRVDVEPVAKPAPPVAKPAPPVAKPAAPEASAKETPAKKSPAKKAAAAS